MCVCVSVLCRVYVTVDSYVSLRTHSEVSVQELLRTVAERLDCAEDDMVLMALTFPEGLNEFILTDICCCVFAHEAALSAEGNVTLSNKPLGNNRVKCPIF